MLICNINKTKDDINGIGCTIIEYDVAWLIIIFNFSRHLSIESK